MCKFGINYLFAWRICYLLEHHTNKADITALQYILFVYSRGFYAVWSSIRTQYSKCCWMNIVAVTSSSSRVIYRRVLNVSCMRLCCLICLCSGVCHSGTVFMFSSRGIFQSLCWLLIGLKCNECVTLMTQIQLIVIFMSYENSFFSTGLYGAEVYVCMCECVREREPVGVGNKGWWLCTVPLQFILLCSWKEVTAFAASCLEVGAPLSQCHWYGKV